MEQRDLIKDQIEQLGKVLAQILSDFLGLKSKGQTSQAIELSERTLQNQLDIEPEKLIALSKQQLTDYLTKRHLTAEHLDVLSEYLKEIGKIEMENNRPEAKIKFKKAIELLDIADKTSKITSFVRVNKKSELKSLLLQLN